VSISEFVRRPVPLGLLRARGSVTAVRAARPAATATAAAAMPGGVPVLRLVCDLTDRADGLEEAVLARLAGLRAVGTVVLDLGSGAGLDDGSRQALCELREVLLRHGTGLRLVVTSREAREGLAAATEHPIGRDAVHDCARSAMLAAFAQAPEPGLVGAVMRDALAAPPDTL
jgi:MFS superfamily sulfate permease-like transporter